jgi:hypothetical protein
VSGSTIFDYTIDPAKVDYSVSDTQLSVVTLTITATNRTSGPVECSAISISIPVGFGAGALTEDPTSIVAAPGPTTPWAVGGGGGTWIAVPLPPVTSVPAGASVSFVLSAVTVNTAQGLVTVDIGETTDQTRAGSVSVDKPAPVPPGSTPVIKSFAADPVQLAQGGTSTLSWQVSDAQQLVLRPGPVNLPDPGEGTLPVTLRETTVFTLEALGTGGRARAAATVTVMPVSIASFTADPATPVPAGTQVTLQWSTRFAAACAIDQGIGPVPASGTYLVRPGQSTVYTLSALGLDPQSSSITVPVTAAQ